MKSNIQSEEFYQEAEDMQTGWGEYLRSIDELKDKVANKDDISLPDACWILYGDGHCSWTLGKFKEYCTSKKWEIKTMPWDAWNGIFKEFVKTI